MTRGEAGRRGPYTVVLDWSGSDYGAFPAPVVHVMAESALEATARAREAAWSQWAGEVREIPWGAAFEEAAADDLWYCVTVLLGHAPEAEGWADSGL